MRNRFFLSTVRDFPEPRMSQLMSGLFIFQSLRSPFFVGGSSAGLRHARHLQCDSQRRGRHQDGLARRQGQLPQRALHDGDEGDLQRDPGQAQHPSRRPHVGQAGLLHRGGGHQNAGKVRRDRNKTNCFKS